MKSYKIIAISLLLSSLALGCKGDKDKNKAPETGKVVTAPTEPPKPAAKPVKAIPEGFFTITPMLVVSDIDAAVEFYTKAFDAKKRFSLPGPDGKPFHAEIMIGDSIIMLSNEMQAKSPKSAGGTNGSLMLYVIEADKAIETAVAAGATITMPPMDAFWGDRFGMVDDPYGHRWGIGTHKEEVSKEQMAARGAAFAKDPASVAKVIADSPGTPATSHIPAGYHTITPSLVLNKGAETLAFYKAAFGAEEKDLMVMPDGTLMHAALQIGDSLVFFSDENPMAPTAKSATNLGTAPFSLMMYVQDADAAYAKAIANKAAEAMKMADMFWGDRFGVVADPAGNPWSIATHKEDLSPAQINERMKAYFATAGDHGAPTAQ